MRDKFYKAGWGSVVIVLIAAIAISESIVLCAGCHPYRSAWLKVANVADARDAVDDSLRKQFKDRIKACIKRNKRNMLGAQTCLEESPEYSAMAKWRIRNIPQINDADKKARAILLLAKHVNATSKSVLAKVKSALGDAACIIIEFVNNHKELFPYRDSLVMRYLSDVDKACGSSP